MLEVIIGFFVILGISLLSLLGVFMISLKENTLDRILFILIAFATGTILATALFDLIPEAIHHLEEINEGNNGIPENVVFFCVIAGFVAFFIIERFIYWFHGHAHEHENKMVCYENVLKGENYHVQKDERIKRFALLNLFGDGLHNFLDGVVIIVAFLNGIPTGIIITLAVFFHELPQEIGDFGILIYGGFSKNKALLYNFLSAIIAIFGGIFGLILSNVIDTFNLFILAFAGGGFLYLASTELLPELLHQKNLRKSILQALIFISGIILIICLVLLLPHE